MPKRIVIVVGHPSLERAHLGHALSDAYAGAATATGHEVRMIELGELEIPVLRSATDWKNGPLPAVLTPAQDALRWADHLVLVYPLWTGTAPALVKAFLEQLLRPGFAFRPRPDGKGLLPGLTGKSARVVVTMGMPALFFRWGLGAWGVRHLNRDALGFAGMKPVRTTYIGGVEAPGFRGDRWITRMHRLGSAGI